MSPRLARRASFAAASLLFALPLALALPIALREGMSLVTWHGLWSDPQTPQGWRLSVGSALASTGIALLLTMLIVTQLHGGRMWRRVAASLPALLAVPHAAFAIGVSWLIAPAGWIARLLAPFAGWVAPTDVATVNDPRGLALVAVLVLKELPFLLWNVAALLTRPEVAGTLGREIAIARTLGYSRGAWWWRVGWMQWLPRLAWPLAAVLAYSLTVVDLGLIVGPGSPPTLAVWTWQQLADANPERNAEGAAAAVLLTLTLLGVVLLAAALHAGLGRAWRIWSTNGARTAPRQLPRQGERASRLLAAGVAAVYAAAAASLVVLSVAGAWRFPALLPELMSSQAWQQVLDSGRTVAFTAGLAVASAAAALCLTVAWLEAAPERWDRRIAPLVLAPLVLPQLLLMVGLYRMALALRLDGTLPGLAWVHGLMVLPYVFTALAPAWRSYDRRYEWTALALGRSRRAFWWRVKWPMLAAPLASALAVGFAVSVAQFLSTQFIGAGRLATLTTEAVTLASGGQRNTAAAFAMLQALLPLIGFGAAAWVARRTRIGAKLTPARTA